MHDLIDRQAAIDALDVLKRNYPSSCFEDLCKAVDIAIKALEGYCYEWEREERMSDLISRQSVLNILLYHNASQQLEMIQKLPSAQPEIVRCKDCIFHGLCRTSTRWAVAPKDDWYCADAERRTDE